MLRAKFLNGGFMTSPALDNAADCNEQEAVLNLPLVSRFYLGYRRQLAVTFQKQCPINGKVMKTSKNLKRESTANGTR
jgi:hypothetical protein